MKAIGTYTVEDDPVEQGNQRITTKRTYQLGVKGVYQLISKEETIETLHQGQVVSKDIITYRIYTIEDDSSNPVNNGDPIVLEIKVKQSTTEFDYSNDSEETIVFSFSANNTTGTFVSASRTEHAYDNGLLDESIKEIYTDEDFSHIKGIETTSYSYHAGTSNIKTKSVVTEWETNDNTDDEYSVSSEVVTSYTYDQQDHILKEDEKGYSYIYTVNAEDDTLEQQPTKTLVSWDVKEYGYEGGVKVSESIKTYYSFANGIPLQMREENTEYEQREDGKTQISRQSVLMYSLETSYAVLPEGFTESDFSLTSTYEEYREVSEVDSEHPEVVVKYIANIYERNAETGELVQTTEDKTQSWEEVNQLREEADIKEAAVERKKDQISRLNQFLQDFNERSLTPDSSLFLRLMSSMSFLESDVRKGVYELFIKMK